VNVLKAHKRITIETLQAGGASQREIARRTGVDRKTIRRQARAANSPGVATGSESPSSQIPPPRPPGDEGLLAASAPGVQSASRPTPSACEAHRAWIEAQVQLGRNAVSIYQDLVEGHGFSHRYNSVKRFVAHLRRREPERFDVLEYLPGEEAQVDYGQGALTLHKPGRYKRPYLFVMTLKYSGKSFRKTVWKTDQQVWAQLHEQAFREFGGCPQYVVLDNLKEGVIRPDLYEPELNSVYAAMLAHYGVVADPCRVRDPNRKGTVENAIQHTQATALKGRRFDSIDAQNTWLAHWEERWAAPRIHGRKKRQVLEMFREERPHLKPLPGEGFRYFRQVTRTVDDAGLIQVESSYYAALPARPHSEVTVRNYDREIEILDLDGQVLRRHEKALRKGSFTIEGGDRLFNPSRETVRLLTRTDAIGPSTAALAREIFARTGRPGQRAIYGLANLTRTYPRTEVEAVCARLLQAQCVSYAAVKRALERRLKAASTTTVPALTQSGPVIRDLAEYQSFWETHSQTRPQEDPDVHVDR
jgi:transposase